MTELELRCDASTAVSHFDAEGICPTTATLTIYKPDGTVAETPAVTKPTASTTVASGVSATGFTLTSATGFSVGQQISVTSDGVVYVAKIARLDGAAVYLQDALPLVVDTGATVKALTMTASVAALGTAAIGTGYRAVWAYSDATASRTAAYQAAVVRWAWTSPVSGADVRSVLANSFQERKSEAFCDRVASTVSDRIQSQIYRTGRRPWLYLSPYVFAEAARQGIRYTLAEEGIYPGGDAIAAVREMRFAFEDAMTQALTAAAYDSTASGQVDTSAQSTGGIYTIRAVR